MSPRKGRVWGPAPAVDSPCDMGWGDCRKMAEKCSWVLPVPRARRGVNGGRMESEKSLGGGLSTGKGWGRKGNPVGFGSRGSHEEGS